jgi:hypothetical protein
MTDNYSINGLRNGPLRVYNVDLYDSSQKSDCF